MKTPTNAVPVLMEKPEEPLLPSHLLNEDHVGFIDRDGKKGYVITTGKFIYHAILASQNESVCNGMWTDYNPKKGMSEIVEYILPTTKQIFKFSTRRDLYKWLAED